MSMTRRSARLTRVQRQYLDLARTQQFTYGWGGYKSTQTVRILEAQGLITVRWLGEDHWRVQALTPAGKALLDADA